MSAPGSGRWTGFYIQDGCKTTIDINLKFNQDFTVKGEGWNPEYTVTGTWQECASVDFTQNFGKTCTYFTGTEMRGKITGKLGFQPNCLYHDYELNFCD